MSLSLLVILCSLAPALGQFTNSNCAENRVALVHLFEWKWSDVAAECERFLAPMGYCGVQVSPVTEHIWVDSEPFLPWWIRYQPISYNLVSRSGTEEEFADMVRRCNNVNVRIYADAIINHMAGMGREGYGIGGTYYHSTDDGADFPGVPYTSENFNSCENCGGCCCVDSWTDHAKVRDCPLSGLIDLNLGVEDTVNKVAELLNRMIGYGIAGFRIDAGKHMWPADIEVLESRLNDLNTEWFPPGSKPFVYPEVIDMDQNGEIRVQEYTHLGRVTEFRYCSKIRETVDALWSIGGLFDPGWGMLNPDEAFVFVDNHDNQRGHGGGGAIINFQDPVRYKKAQAITLANDYGYPRVMSSYDFGDNTEAGPPSDENGNTDTVPINPDGSCGGDWVCEHRWQAIAGMASFRKAVNGQSKSSITTVGNGAYFHWGNKGFFAITNDGMNMNVYTGLPGGTYCNVIKGCPTESGCEGESVVVDSNGNAQINIPQSDEPMLAIHAEALSGSGGCTDSGPVPEPTTPEPTTPGSTVTVPTTTTMSTETPSTTSGTTVETTTNSQGTTTTGPGDYRRTVIFINAQTQPGNDLFFNGGISHDQRGCSNSDTAETSGCALSIVHNQLGSSPHYDAYNAWRIGDSKLDWYSAQEGQGTNNGVPAMGTPGAWTTNDPSHEGYQELNTMGPNYWMVDFNMNCDEAEDGWFEFKAYVTGWGWENDVFSEACSGGVGGSPPYSSNNHFALCGHINTFSYNSNSCIIDSM